MFAPPNNFAQRLLGGVDLVIDLATLGEYGLELLPAERSRSARAGNLAGWEAASQTVPDRSAALRSVNLRVAGERPRGDRTRKRASGRRRGHVIGGPDCAEAFDWPPRQGRSRGAFASGKPRLLHSWHGSRERAA